MNEYRVTWEMDLDAASPQDAARKALEALIRPVRAEGAHVFDVNTQQGELVETVDLDALGPR